MNLQKFTLWSCVREAEHVDVGAGAEHAVALAADHHGADLGMLEAQALHHVGQLDVDAEVVGVELQLVAGLEAAILVHVHGEVGDAVLERELPVFVAAGLGAEVDDGGCRPWRFLFP